MVVSVAPSSGGSVGGRKFSTVVPATVTGEKAAHQLSNMDLAMKLHYVRGVYYFRDSAGLGTRALKVPMFELLQRHFQVSGRIRRSDAGRPFVKCNDSGVRIVEATCALTLEDWLQIRENSHHRHLVPDHVLGPNLYFSPLVLIQFTWFKGGGFALGLSWSHVLGDAASAISFMYQYGQILGADGGRPSALEPQRHVPPDEHYPASPRPPPPVETGARRRLKEPPLSVKPVDLVDGTWVAPGKHKMESFSFHVPENRLRELCARIGGNIAGHLNDGRPSTQADVRPFEALCAVVWQSVAKARLDDDRGPRTVTVCRAPTGKCCDDDGGAKDGTIEKMSNGNQCISTVAVADPEVSPSQMDLTALARLISDAMTGPDESPEIDQEVDGGSGSPDMILYGANLTFVDLEGTDLYGLQVKGQKPIAVDYSIDGVGDEGTVLVLRDGGESSGAGRVLNVVLPEQQLLRLSQDLAGAWDVLP